MWTVLLQYEVYKLEQTMPNTPEGLPQAINNYFSLLPLSSSPVTGRCFRELKEREETARVCPHCQTGLSSPASMQHSSSSSPAWKTTSCCSERSPPQPDRRRSITGSEGVEPPFAHSSLRWMQGKGGGHHLFDTMIFVWSSYLPIIWSNIY